MPLNRPRRRVLAWALGVAFLAVVVLPIALFYGLDFRLDTVGGSTCRYLNSDTGDASGLWAALAWLFAPLAGGVIAYAAVIFFAPGRLGRTRWRFAIGLPVGALVTVAVFFAAFSGLLLWDSCPD